jgi:hypothetical protein
LICFFQAVDLRDVGAIERRQRLRLAREARQPLRIGGKRLWQDLDRDVAIQPRVARPIDLAHATSADWGEDLVRAEAGAGGRQGAAII